ncbi:MAG: glycosyltransferase [Acidimicrobiales bacterium]|nr:glycosyltransferase [Acidimicrobiales bacterium]
MRVGLVSAHYPPNFVSGGTLVPQRIAHALVDRGHDVAVFAGELDPVGPPLDTRIETDARGVEVSWVNITPFTSWADPANYDNPPVADIFDSWLNRVSPDVVHLHSVQTLGGSLVSVARDHGCRTILTMHDFWWTCARQFLVDTSGQPCSLVVDAGVCGCQSGRAALEARTATLEPHIAAADVVLTPSEITAEVMRANGIPAQRLLVNENGMIPTTRAAARQPSDRVRFRYTGGPDPMKGAGVLLDALAELEPAPSWHLTVHLSPERHGPLAALSTNESIAIEPPYRPDQLDEVFADTDVLVLPSVMRETHSIVTREALLRGVPVLTSDSLGPEQVIEHERNGLIVPTGDPHSLAATIRRLVDDPELLRRLQDSCQRITVRSVEQQVDQLEAVYTEPLPDPTPGWTPRRVVFVAGIDGAPLRYRAQFPAEALELRGVDTDVIHYADPRVGDEVDAADAVIFYRVPATPRIVAIADRARARGTPVAFDVDDLIVDPTIADEIPALRILPSDESEVWLEGVRRYRTTLEHCDAYIGSTQPLVERVGEVTGIPAHRKRNAYGLEVARRSDAARQRPREPGPVRIGYLSGTTTHDEDLLAVTPALVHVLEHRPDVEVWLGGHLAPVDELGAFGPRVRRLPFRPWHELPDLLRQLDVNLAPLADLGAFNQAKSAIKWLEAALVETPTVATASRPFEEAIRDGQTGILVREPESWTAALLRLADDETERRRLGAAARRAALLEWSPHLEGERYLAILRQVLAEPAADRSTTWEDVLVDEQPASGPVPLTPYPSTDEPIDDAPPNVSPGPSLGHKVLWSLRNESWRTVTRRVASRLRR